MSAICAGLACAGMVSAAGAGYGSWRAAEAWVRKRRHRDSVRGVASGRSVYFPEDETLQGFDRAVMEFAAEESHRAQLLLGGSALPGFTGRSAWFARREVEAGLSGIVSEEGFCRARFILCVAGTIVGTLCGSLVSPELACVLFAGGGFAGWRVLPQAVARRVAARSSELERHLPEMLDVIALGMRSGLSFDRSLQLYGEHFSTALAFDLMNARWQWACGLETRDEALRRVAAAYDSQTFKRVVDGMARSLRFGSPMVDGLESAAREARASCRAMRQEKVAKAPVKMMLPTGALILPAMLILVLGPVLLELAGGW